ncbi:hypothetical protein NN561_017750 [Cricetulus griseus]
MGDPWSPPSQPGCTAHGDRRTAGDVALAAWQGDPSLTGGKLLGAWPTAPTPRPDPHSTPAHRSVLRGVFSPRPRGAPRLRTPGVRPSARTPSPGRRARDATLQPPATVRTDGAGTAGEGRAAAGLGLGRRKPQRQQSPGGDDGEGENRTPGRPNLDLGPCSPPWSPAFQPRDRDPTHPVLPCRFGSCCSGFW